MKRHRKRGSSFISAIEAAFHLLFEAYAEARIIEEDPVNLALPVSRLQEAGLGKTDMRWLAQNGFVDLIVSPFSKTSRPFHKHNGLILSSSAGIVLSERAAAFSHLQALMPVIACAQKSRQISASQWRRLCRRKPHWIEKAHEVCIGLHVVKHYEQPAPDQEWVLTCLQEEHWRRVMDDPLLKKQGKDPKRRLNDTIRNLNRCQRDPSIHFYATRDGKGVRWQIVFAPFAKRR